MTQAHPHPSSSSSSSSRSAAEIAKMRTQRAALLDSSFRQHAMKMQKDQMSSKSSSVVKDYLLIGVVGLSFGYTTGHPLELQPPIVVQVDQRIRAQRDKLTNPYR